MLGLIFGTNAGETIFEPLVLILPRFLLPLPPLPSFLSRKMTEGVVALIGDAAIGDCIADPGRAEAGVLKGPSFGVFRADIRGVSSKESSMAISVLMWEGVFAERAFAASGRARSSSPPKSCVSTVASPGWPLMGC